MPLSAGRLCVIPLLGCAAAQAGVLPDNRADLLLHRYEGGGVSIQGPSLLVRKNFRDAVSLAASYDLESISDASIDAVTEGGAFKAVRRQFSLSADVSHGKSTYSGGYLGSTENDYRARTAFLSVSQDMFSDLTTLSFSATRSWDEVGMRGNAAFRQPLDRRAWSVGLTQVLGRNLLGRLDVETRQSEGFLNSPYRLVRYSDPLSARGYSRQLERYPHTRTGNVATLELKYYLPWRAVAEGSYRYYGDTWGIRGKTLRLGYSQPWRAWTFEGHARRYSQNRADFYSDLFPAFNAQAFLARDRQLATFRNTSFGGTASWQFSAPRALWMNRGSVNLSYDRLRYRYDDFRDLRVTVRTPGTEPLYAYDADVMQLFLSIWF